MQNAVSLLLFTIKSKAMNTNTQLQHDPNPSTSAQGGGCCGGGLTDWGCC